MWKWLCFQLLLEFCFHAHLRIVMTVVWNIWYTQSYYLFDLRSIFNASAGMRLKYQQLMYCNCKATVLESQLNLCSWQVWKAWWLKAHTWHSFIWSSASRWDHLCTNACLMMPAWTIIFQSRILVKCSSSVRKLVTSLTFRKLNAFLQF